jgi:hypothetical protein
MSEQRGAPRAPVRHLNVAELSVDDLAALLIGRLVTARSDCGINCGTYTRRALEEAETAA